MDIMVELGVEFNKNKRVKEEALSIAELNAKLKHKMKKNMAVGTTENARKMSIIKEKLTASNAKTDTKLEMLSSSPHPSPIKGRIAFKHGLASFIIIPRVLDR